MNLFYYQIKGLIKDEYGGLSWSFPPLWQDIIEADNKKQAREIINQEYEKNFPLRVSKKDLELGMFILNIQQIKEGDYTHEKLTKIHICEECKKKYTMLEKYKINDGYYNPCYCSRECLDKKKEVVNNINGTAVPVIYRIMNKNNGMCYIGQTTQPFTLRWWQHLSQSASPSTKFHKAMSKTKITDWTFEVIAVPENKTELDKLESDFIEEYDSINKGYNTAVAPNAKSDLKD